MSQITTKNKPIIKKVSRVFDRPLLLSPAQDMRGYITKLIGGSIFFSLACFSVLAVLFIFVFIIAESIPFIQKFGLSELLFSSQWTPTAEGSSAGYGGLTMIVGSLYVTVGALVLAVPIGILTAIFLSDIMPFKLRQIVKPIIELLAAIPSVAYGFFAILVLAPWLQDQGMASGANALNASLILAVMAVPTIVSVSEDAISSVGRDLREGAYSLGSTRAETLVKVVLPASSSGIVAAVILGMMRAIGETMVVWMASGNATKIPVPWWDLSQSIRTMTATIAAEQSEAVKGSDHYHALFSIGLLLLVFTFAMNIISEFLLARSKKKLGGSR